MGNHTVTVLQKSYNISCSETEIPHLQECTDFVNTVLKQIMKTSKTNSEHTLMAMALLTITDELLEHKKNAKVSLSSPTENPELKTVEYVIPTDMLSRLEGLYQKMENNF